MSGFSWAQVKNSLQNFGQRSGWQVLGSSSASAEFGWELVFQVGAGGEGGYFRVAADSHEFDVYQCFYRVVTGSVGIGIGAGAISMGFSTEDMPGWSSYMYRLVGAPNNSGERGAPIGFGGQCLMMAVAMSQLKQQAITLGFFGYDPGSVIGRSSQLLTGVPAAFQPLAYKYGCISIGSAIQSNVGMSVTLKLGDVYSIVNTRTNQRVFPR